MPRLPRNTFPHRTPRQDDSTLGSQFAKCGQVVTLELRSLEQRVTHGSVAAGAMDEVNEAMAKDRPGEELNPPKNYLYYFVITFVGV